MMYSRKYLQFNDLVFDNYDMLKTSDNTSNTFKWTTTEYGYRHGSYLPVKDDYGLLRESSVSLTISLEMRKMGCDLREHYHDLVTQQLARTGYLWAIQDGKLIYTLAAVSGYDEITTTSSDKLEIDVSFMLPEGIWHIADPTSTFLKEYDISEVIDYYGFENHTVGTLPDIKYPTRMLTLELEDGTVKDYDVMINTGSTLLPLSSVPLVFELPSGIREYNVYVADEPSSWYDIVPFVINGTETYNLCVLKENSQAPVQRHYGDLYDVEPSQALAYIEDINVFYRKCSSTYFIIRDCDSAVSFFGMRRYDKLTAQNGIIGERLYINTNLPTRDYKMVLMGKMDDITISINGNTNIIKGKYSKLEILGNGQALGDDKLLPIEKWTVPTGEDYGFSFVPQLNRIVITGFTENGTAYIMADGITI